MERTPAGEYRRSSRSLYFQTKPIAQEPQLGPQSIGDRGCLSCFKPGAEHAKPAASAIRFQIHACDEFLSEQKRQHIESVPALRGGHENLDAVLKPEQSLDARPAPD